MVLFLCFSILEDSGYMARVAFILDKLFRRFGVSGRAFMPMIMGFGCSVPAMANTRTLADEKERNATLRVIPFFSCGAKLPILTAISGGIVMVFGVGNAEIITYSMYVLGMLAAVISLLIMRNTTMRGESAPFIMELPNYHAPRFQNLMFHLWDKLKHYVEKAFTVILASCIVVWFLSNFGWNWQMVESMDQSILASLGKFFQPLFTPLGFGSQLGEWGWVFVVAAVTGLIAKENVVSTFAALAACLPGSIGLESSEEGILEVARMIVATGVTIPGLISFIAFNMTTVPCFASVATAKGEVVKGKFKWTLLFWLTASYLVGIVVYAFGSMFGGSVWAIFVSIALVIVATLFAIGIIIYNKKIKAKDKI
jgi:ferrous iron transport protein B